MIGDSFADAELIRAASGNVKQPGTSADIVNLLQNNDLIEVC
jgi:hypothetical protein